MAAFLGLRGTGDFTSDERPKNYREKILQLFPNGEAPLTALLSMLKSQPTDDPEYNWWEKRLPLQRMLASVGGALSTDVTINVDSHAKDAVKGTVLMNESTGERMYVDQDPTSDTAIHVIRGFGTTAAQAVTAADAITIIGSAYAQGAGVPTSRSYSPDKPFNYTQIFRTSLDLTRTARKTRLRWDNTGPYREARREALQLHSIEMEKGFIWGQRYATIGSNGKPLYTTAGVNTFLETNIGGAFAVNGALDEETLDILMEDVFRYGSNEKLALCGSTFLRALTTLGKRNGTLNVVPSDRTYGMKVVEYITAFGTLMLKNHPLMSQHPTWRKNAQILDVNNLIYRYVDDTMFIPNRQAPGDDLSLDEYMTECGLEVHFEETHAFISGVTGALTT
jgi:Family of unknown function (DUF5309)